MQLKIVKDAVDESLRFKRRHLANLLQEFAEKIVNRKENVQPIVLKNGHR